MTSAEQPRDQTPEDEQRAVVAFLACAENWPDAPARVERHDTHGARVFLAGDRALKIKRAVAYDYMDFSTLEKRRAALEKELAINQPHAPQIYRGLVAITRDADGRLAIGGSGEAIEWALAMSRFDQADLLGAIAARGAFDDDLARLTAKAIATYHDDAAAVTAPDGAARIAATIDHLAASGLPDHQPAQQSGQPQGQQPRPRLFPAAEVAAWADAARDRLAGVRALLDARARGGAVRRAHGDLHLANIVVLDGEPVLFDAIEFDDDIRTVDRMYDLAFLLMDLDFRGQTAAANTVLQHYLAAPPLNDDDIDALRALPLFLSLRAAIRAMTARQRAAASPPGSSRDAAQAEARAYFDRARAYLAPPPPRLIAIGGLSGTGKSTLARALAPEIAPVPGAIVVRTDVERKRLFGAAETDRLLPASYTPGASARVYAATLAKAARILDAGHSAILDAVFADERERDAAAGVAHTAGASFTGLWLEAPPAVLHARVSARTGDASDATAAVVEAQLVSGATAGTWIPVPAADRPAETLARARHALAATAP